LVLQNFTFNIQRKRDGVKQVAGEILSVTYGDRIMSKTLSAVILAGGKSRRFGTNKALSMFHGERLIERLARSLGRLTHNVQIVTHTPEELAFLGLPMTGDLIPGCGPLGGIHTAIKTSGAETVVCVACDMPFVTDRFLRYMTEQAVDCDVVVPISAHGEEPLCAVYRDSCLSAVETCLHEGQYKITGFYERVRVKRILPEDTPLYDPWMFFNVNTREDYEEALRHLAVR